jgi:hypothetical protein
VPVLWAPLLALLWSLAVWVNAARAALFAVVVWVADCQLEFVCVAVLAPVVPDWEDVSVFGSELLAAADWLLVGVAVAEPVFEVEPPVALTAPDWLKPMLSVFWTLDPTTSPRVVLAPVLPPLPPIAMLPLPSPPAPLWSPHWLLAALPFEPLLVEVAGAELFVAVDAFIASPHA